MVGRVLYEDSIYVEGGKETNIKNKKVATPESLILTWRQMSVYEQLRFFWDFLKIMIFNK